MTPTQPNINYCNLTKISFLGGPIQMSFGIFWDQQVTVGPGFEIGISEPGATFTLKLPLVFCILSLTRVNSFSTREK